jgi:3-mercaptopyruvate sulfurtransferase SseA
VLDLNAQGITNTAALLGGWNSWKQANQPTESGLKPAQNAKKK